MDNKEKPSKDKISRFTEMYEDCMKRKKEMDLKLKNILEECREVDELAEEGYQYANKHMYFTDKNGMLCCANKSISKKVGELDYLRDYSFEKIR